MQHSIWPPPHRPPKPQECEGILLPRIVACERRSIADLHTVLEVSALPNCTCPPWALSAVQAGAGQTRWRMIRQDVCGRMTAEITIPLFVTVCDRHGCPQIGTSELKIETALPCSFCQDCILILPCVQLRRGECRSNDSCFDAVLSVSLVIYQLRPEPCRTPCPTPACPQLPLYPPPIRDRCM